MRRHILAMLTLLTAVNRCFADVTVGSPFQEHMVLQQGVRVPVWGEADSGKKVTVEFAGQKVEATADAQGRWRATLEPLQVSAEPQTMTIRAGQETKEIGDVLVGEVWLAGGQSNMEWSLAGARDGAKEVAAANYPQIRMFTARHRPASNPQARIDGTWAVCEPKKAGAFSAVGYFFARDLHEQLKVPIGIVHSSWGGTAAQSWTPIETLRQVKSINDQIGKYDARVTSLTSADFAQKQTQSWAAYATANAAWLNSVADHTQPTAAAEWKPIRMPNESTLYAWHFLGTMWLRKEIEIPTAWVGQDLTLGLGIVDDVDETFVNGTRVGGMGYGDAAHGSTPRVYNVPASLVTGNRVSLLVGVMNVHSFGGLIGPREALKLSRGDESVSLAGTWEFTPGKLINRVDVPRPIGMPTPLFPDVGSPSNLYNGMIAPLVPYALRGVIWYQGETNAGQPEAYRELFPALINSWREAWGASAEAMPFGFVQLANFNKPQGAAPIESPGGWGGLRDAQFATLKNVPNTGMAVAIDIGEEDIHPKNKQDVGHRLALWALAKTYGKDIAYSGPIYRSAAVEGNAIRISFDHADGLTIKGDEPVGFAIAGEDKVFYPATAKIDGDAVVVSSEKVTKPVAVRYAWATNPRCNLFNKAGLPASPFRTDDWAFKDSKIAK